MPLKNAGSIGVCDGAVGIETGLLQCSKKQRPEKEKAKVVAARVAPTQHCRERREDSFDVRTERRQFA